MSWASKAYTVLDNTWESKTKTSSKPWTWLTEMVTWIEIPDILYQRKQYQLWFIDIFIYHLFTSMIYCYLFLSLIRNHMTSHLGSRFKIYAKNIIQSRHKKFIERFKISAKHLICKLLQLLSKTLNQLSWATYHTIEG